MKSKAGSKKRDRKQLVAKSKATNVARSAYTIQSQSRQKQVEKHPKHVMTNLGLPRLRDSKFVVEKFAPPNVQNAIKNQVKKFNADSDALNALQQEIKGQFGQFDDYFLKYSSPSIIDDKHLIGRRKAQKIDLSGIPDISKRQQKWPYDYRPIICKHIAQNELQSCLNKIFPPKEWTIKGEDWHQSVSPIPAARIEVINLKSTLEKLLKSKNTKIFGLCSNRLELYLQCFDELIRQVTICCLERGLIMAQVRDTIKSTLRSYHTVYESCCALGLRKTLNHEEELVALSTSITNVLEERDKIRDKIVDMEKKIESVKDMFVNHSNLEEKKHMERMVLLQKANDQIKQALLSTAEFGPKRKKVIKAPAAVRSLRGHNSAKSLATINSFTTN